MNPDDQRHGSRAGYIAGCRDDCCGLPHYRYQKRSRLRLMREGSQIIPAAPTLERVTWWRDRGVSINAIVDAAGLGYGTLAEINMGERDVCLRSTEQAILAVTWAHLSPRSMCSAEMTKRRIYSLMASGHTLTWIAERADGLPISGRWRHQDRVRVSLARAVAEVSASAPPLGASQITAVKARNRGHLPIVGWDDPGDPAMPRGWRPAGTVRSDEIDEAIVDRLLAFSRIDSTPAEKAEALRRWIANGGSERDMCIRMGWKQGRYKVPEAAA